MGDHGGGGDEVAAAQAWPPQASGRVVGRDAEVGRLAAVLEAAGAGAAATVLVEGEAGIGKTTLVQAVAARARAQGWLVVVGHCVRLGGTSLSYAPFVEVLRGLRDEIGVERLRGLAGPGARGLARLLPGLGEEDGRSAWGDAVGQEQVFGLVVDLLVGLSHERRSLIVVEDLHWADPSSADLFVYAARSLRRHPVVLLATSRSDEPPAVAALGPMLGELGRLPSTVTVGLGRLGRADLAELAAARLGHPPTPGDLDTLVERTGGNPFFAEQILASGGPAALVPARLRDALLARLAGMPPAAVAVLRLAAVAGDVVDHGILAATSGLDEDELLRAVGELVDRRLLVGFDSGYRFSHALVREVVYDQIVPGERMSLHRRLAEAMTAASGVAATLAHHWGRAGNRPEALAASVVAGREAEAAGAFSEASEHYERALALWDEVPDPAAVTGVDRVVLLGLAGDAAGFVPRSELAVARLRAAVDGLDPAVDPVPVALLRTRLVYHLWSMGRDRDAAVAAEAAAGLVRDLAPSADQTKVLATWSLALMISGDPAEAEAAAGRALALAETTGADEARCNALSALGTCLVARGETERGISALRESLDIARECGRPLLLCRGYLNLSDALIGGDRLAEALDVTREGLAAARRVGLYRSRGALILVNAAEAMFELGRWDECRRALDEIDDLDPDVMTGVTAATITARLAAAQGDLIVAASAADRARHLARGVAAARVRVPLAIADATVALAGGRCDDAADVVDRCLDDPGTGVLRDQELLCLLLHGVRAEVRRAEVGRAARTRARPRRPSDGTNVADGTGATDAADPVLVAAKQLAVRARTLAGDHPGARAAATLVTIDAELSRGTGQHDPAVWAAAVAANEAVGRLHDAAAARLGRGEALLARPGGRQEAARELHAAGVGAEQLGARPLGDEITALARRARLDLDVGQRPASSAMAASPPSTGADRADTSQQGAWLLTSRELDVLRLVAAGRTNPEIAQALFISRKTAGNHVSHILTKLGVANRVQAAAMGLRLGLLDAGGRAE
jgi:DNA-binding CsgD family transcriptional regulator/tetratricopeptide (TPR) repeat protein